MLTTATTTRAAAAIASLAEVFVSANLPAGHHERRCTAERADRVVGSSASAGDGDELDSGNGAPDGATLAVLAASRLRSSGRSLTGSPAPPEGEAPTT